MNDSYTEAMFAPINPPVLLDEEVATEKWPRPEPFVWSPRPSLFERLKVWLCGTQESEE
jgi:hypothetical protein